MINSRTSKIIFFHRNTWKVCRISAPTFEEIPGWENQTGLKKNSCWENWFAEVEQTCQSGLRKSLTNFYEEQAVEDRTSVETVKEKFYTNLTEQFMFSLPTLLFKFLIEKGVGHIVEPHPSLH